MQTVEGPGSTTDARLNTFELCISGLKMSSLHFKAIPSTWPAIHLATWQLSHDWVVTWSHVGRHQHIACNMCVSGCGDVHCCCCSWSSSHYRFFFFSGCDYNLQYVADFFSLKLHLFITKKDIFFCWCIPKVYFNKSQQWCSEGLYFLIYC